MRQCSWHRFEAGLCEVKLFGGRVMRNEAAGGGLHETGLLASFGGWFMRNETVCFVRGQGYAKGLHEKGCWRRFGAEVCKTKLFASLGAWLCNIQLLTYLMGLPSHFHTPNAHR